MTNSSNILIKQSILGKGTDFYTENMGGMYSIEFPIHADGQGGVSEPHYLQGVSKLNDWLLAQPEVTHVNTVTDTFKRLNRSMHADE